MKSGTLDSKDSGISVWSEKSLTQFSNDFESMENKASENYGFDKDVKQRNKGTCAMPRQTCVDDGYGSLESRERNDSVLSSSPKECSSNQESIVCKTSLERKPATDLNRLTKETNEKSDDSVARTGSVRFLDEEESCDKDDKQDDCIITDTSHNTNHASEIYALPCSTSENRTDSLHFADSNRVRDTTSCFSWFFHLLHIFSIYLHNGDDGKHAFHNPEASVPVSVTLDHNQAGLDHQRQNNQHVRSVSQHIKMKQSPEDYLQMEDYAAAYLTENGGRIQIANTGICLYVPEGALPTGSRQLIEVEIKCNRGLSHLNDRESWLTPTIRCGPSGQQFLKFVYLVVPHCAADIEEWDVFAHESKSNVWDRTDTLVFKDEHFLVMMMDHFCGQKISGRPHSDAEEASKEMVVTIYQEKSEGQGTIWVQLSNAYIGKSSFDDDLLKGQPEEYYVWPNAIALQFFRKPQRYRRICCAFDFLIRINYCERGWESVAKMLKLDASIDVVASINTGTQSLRSPGAVFLNAYFDTRKRENVGRKQALRDLHEACRVIDSFKPASIISEELDEILQEQFAAERTVLRQGTVCINNAGDDISVKCSTKDHNGKGEVEKLISLKSAWSATDGYPNSDCVRTFEINNIDPCMVTIKVSQGENERCYFVYKKTYQKSSLKTKECSFHQAQITQHRIVHNRTTSYLLDFIQREWRVKVLDFKEQKVRLFREETISPEYCKDVEFKAKKHDQSVEEVAKHLQKATSGLHAFRVTPVAEQACRTVSVMSADSGFASIAPDFNSSGSYTDIQNGESNI